MGNNLISCRCKKKIIIVCNSIEAKYKSLENTTLEIQWLQSILCEIDLKIPQPPMLWCDILEPHTLLLILSFMLVQSISKLTSIMCVKKFKEKNIMFSLSPIEISLMIL
jgi:hypothetical protein